MVIWCWRGVNEALAHLAHCRRSHSIRVRTQFTFKLLFFFFISFTFNRVEQCVIYRVPRFHTCTMVRRWIGTSAAEVEWRKWAERKMTIRLRNVRFHKTLERSSSVLALMRCDRRQSSHPSCSQRALISRDRAMHKLCCVRRINSFALFVPFLHRSSTFRFVFIFSPGSPLDRQPKCLRIKPVSLSIESRTTV